MKKILKNQTLQSLMWIILIVVIWEVSSQTGMVNNYILPKFSDVIGAMVNQICFGELGHQILNSLTVIILGFFVSVAISIIITALCVLSKVCKSLFVTLCTIFNPLPGMALLPLIMMWFGIGNGAMIALIVHGVMWPLVTNLLGGIKNVPQIYDEWADNIELSPIIKVKEVYLFSVMPSFISGLRIGWGRAWRALISAEMVFGMIGSLGGIGYYIYTNRAYANMTNVIVGIVVIIIIGLIVDRVVFYTIEKLTVMKWGMSIER
ncbi:MAG: ABC transporter permease subunit [Lachnospiraceae bacterium]|nr:ABC transporter permease subunit [Lachnospiraceae bacterium]